MKVHVQDGEIAITSPVTRYLLPPDEARQLILELQAGLFALQETARKQAREARAAALWAEWLAAGAIAETSGGLLRRDGWQWLRPGQVDAERVPPGVLFVAPVWGVTFSGKKAHYWLGLGKRWCGRPDRLCKVVDPEADGVELCKSCAKASGGAA